VEAVDIAFDAVRKIAAEAIENLHKIRTEEDAKLQIITRVLTEVLGWAHSDIGTEVANKGGYSDYEITDNGHPIIVVEAKKRGVLEVGSVERGKIKNLKIKGPSLQKTQDGIFQVAGYANPRGIPLAVLTDGEVWIVLRPHVEGAPFWEKETFTFPSMDAVLNNFSTFYEILSKESCQKRLYRVLFDEIHNTRNIITKKIFYPLDSESINISKKSDLAFDLDRVFENFFSRMKGDDDPDLLMECFVETRESRVADFSLEKMTARVLGNLSPEELDVEEELSKFISDAVALDEGESIFIVGPTGAGKTTFIDRFFRKTLSSSIRERCIPIRINCLDATGSASTVISWMVERIISEIEEQVFDGVGPNWDELRGLYFAEYKRRSRGVDAKLYQRDKDAFHEQFGRFMAGQVEDDREGYLRRLLRDLVDNRKKLPVVIVDNTDEFPPEFKVSVFQFSQSLRREIKHCIIIYPVTDKSAWAFSKTDIYGIYRTKSFFLPTPPPREVFRKRIEYLKKKLSKENSSDVEIRSYLSNRGIKVSIKNLEKFADVLEGAFVNHEYTAKTLGELSNYNIRKTLRLSRRVITSAVFKMEEILAAYTAQGVVSATTSKRFMNALLKGDYELFKPGDVAEIIPIFKVDEKVVQSPLIHSRILTLLEATLLVARDVDKKHMSISSIHEYFEVCGCSEAAIDNSLLFLLSSGLIEPFDPSVAEISSDQKLAITHSGRAHLRLAERNMVFCEQMALTTGILDQEVSLRIAGEFQSSRNISSRFDNIRQIFAEYLLAEDKKYIRIPEKGEQFECQRNLTTDIERFLGDGYGPYDEASRGKGGLSLQRKEGILVTIDFFSQQKGFGFAEAVEVDGRIFLRKEVLNSAGIDSVWDGDDLLCDVEFSEKGPQVVKVHDIQSAQDGIEQKRCEIVRLFSERYYGFMRPLGARDLQEDALFHFSLCSDQEIEKLRLGMEVEVEVKSVSGRVGPQVRRIVKFH